ncbi:MAG: tetratricopeptide repeat protein, partial [Anaerolineae bacterium]
TQEVAYTSLAFALRRDLHQRIGRFLEQHYSGQLETMYGTLAHHFAQGGQPAQALPYALAAGGQAQALFANDEALAYYRQAERLLAQLPAEKNEDQAVQLYLGRGELHTLLGNFDEAEADLERGLELAQMDKEDRCAQAQALNRLAYLRWWQSRNDEMLQLSRRALALAEAGNHRREMMTALRYTANALEELEQHDEALGFFVRARNLAEALDDRQALSVVHMGIALAAFRQGQLRNALGALEQLLVIYRESGDKGRAADCLSNMANALYLLGDFEAARTTFQESIAIDREIGKRVGLAYSLCDLGTLYCHRGDYGAGLAAMEEAKVVFEEIDDDVGRAYCEMYLGRGYYLDVGPDTQAEALLRRALPVLQRSESHEQVVETLLAIGLLHLRRGESDLAKRNLDEARGLCKRYDLHWRLPEATLYGSELALEQGDRAMAADLASQTLAAIEDKGCPDFGAGAHMVLARLADDPQEHFELAVNAARQRSRRIDLARTLLQVGSYLRDRTEAELQAQGHAYLKEAQALVEQMGFPNSAFNKP